MVWDPHLAKDIQLSGALQLKAARFVSNSYQRTVRVTDIINKLDWESLKGEKLYEKRTLVFKNSFFPRTIPVWNKPPNKNL